MAQTILYGPDNRPLPSSGAKPFGMNPISLTGGSFRGTLSNYLVSRQSEYGIRRERQLLADRAEDLTANDPNAASTIGSMSINTVGTGFTPQSRPNAEILGWDEETTKKFQSQAEWAWNLWQAEADASGRFAFWQICLTAIRSFLVKGEFFRIPVMINDPNRIFSLALQAVDPLRIYTPTDKTDSDKIRDGVEFGRFGRPLAYWVANPSKDTIASGLSSSDFTRVRSRASHRPGMIHVFRAENEEQMRGVSILAPAIKFFRDLSDYLDYELVGAIIASSFPVFIETSDPHGTAQGISGSQNPDEKSAYHEAAPGSILYGNINEKPHVLKNDRPGNSFDKFVERILRSIGASVGMPYEIISKDFSKTNYSSARAALLEAWRVFGVYQKWMIDSFCQPVWEMVLEEAWLRGMITLPAGSPDWYEIPKAYTKATWIPPKRGNVDPKKEMEANILGLQHNIITLSDILSETGGGDYEDKLKQRAREREMEKEHDIVPPADMAIVDSGNEPEPFSEGNTDE